MISCTIKQLNNANFLRYTIKTKLLALPRGPVPKAKGYNYEFSKLWTTPVKNANIYKANKISIKIKEKLSAF